LDGQEVAPPAARGRQDEEKMASSARRQDIHQDLDGQEVTLPLARRSQQDDEDEKTYAEFLEHPSVIAMQGQFDAAATMASLLPHVSDESKDVKPPASQAEISQKKQKMQ
jgi:hypothetical protein